MKTIIKHNLHKKLTLVGAGPGDPDLITIKGLKAIQIADVILYDALIHIGLLDSAKPNCIKIFVGKRSGTHSMTQEEINVLIVENAQKYGHVVRLKGGDSFVFGRGLEEIKFAEQKGIATEVIPGITSAIGVPAVHGIPVTCRKVNESFWVVTGHTMDGKLSDDLKLATQSSATVIILMGMANLLHFVEIYKQMGLGSMPIAIIQSGTLPEERIVLGRIDNIHNLVKQEGIKNPAVIVIGKVVELHRNWRTSMEELNIFDNGK